MDRQEHWQKIYHDKHFDQVSWYQDEARTSLNLIRESALRHDQAMIDVGGGASGLVDTLLADGYRDVTVLDLSSHGLDQARTRIGPASNAARWITADITRYTPTKDLDDPPPFYLWHDRAVYHFLTDPADQHAYRTTLCQSLKVGGHLILAAFADDGPTKCSGLTVRQFSPDSMTHDFAEYFTLVRHIKETHQTPSGSRQSFLYGLYERHG
ncbi:MAG: class I SAM-dependent methyltransferase [Magnetococcales bacterium]|nr:class I SAM-dependent methyltransferase [Magnetococcales bacterium]